MLRLETSSKYKKDRKLMKRQGRDMSLLDGVLTSSMRLPKWPPEIFIK
jgi:mRNA-degrading endonuclease YafQ of YafQ-DinJ toxin-antitoxin module